MAAESGDDGNWREAADQLFADLAAEWSPEGLPSATDVAKAEPLPLLCEALLLDGSTCLLPTEDEQECAHRDPGPAPAELHRLVAQLRHEVGEAREVACVLASLTRYYHGSRGVSVAVGRIGPGEQPPWWLEPGEPGWPPTRPNH